jgi:hypothetical protein
MLQAGCAQPKKLQLFRYFVVNAATHPKPRWREEPMKNGFRVYDTDTHIDPGADVLER